MLNNKRTCELAVHFNSLRHDISQVNFILIEQITKFKNSIHLDKLLLTREASWTAQLFTLNSHGLNKDVNFVQNTESITTVCFTTQLLVGLSLSIVIFCYTECVIMASGYCYGVYLCDHSGALDGAFVTF